MLLLLQVYGANQETDVRRMSTSRCAELMVIAIANRLSEVWIGHHPALFFVYCMQFLPSITFRFVFVSKVRLLRHPHPIKCSF